MLTAAWEPKLIDCGLSKLLSAEQAARPDATTTSAWIGTNGYICPTYFKTAMFDTAGKGDVFSFGVLLCEARTAPLPFVVGTAR